MHIAPTERMLQTAGRQTDEVGKQRVNDTPETLAPENPRSWWARPGVWIVTIGVAAIVVIEGFTLSWGGTAPQPKSPSVTIVTISPQPSFQASCVGKHTYLEVDYVHFGPFEPAFLAGTAVPAVITGREMTYQCGGPDDGHFNYLPTVKTFTLSPRVKIELLEVPSLVYYNASLQQLNEYLAADFDRNFFLVVGPPSGATTLRAMYVP